ncbi:hypothetical protein HOG98_00980 [bacterium]|nr:hypothetical protein [bacterium]
MFSSASLANDDGYRKIYEERFSQIEKFNKIDVFHYELGKSGVEIKTKYLVSIARGRLASLFPKLVYDPKIDLLPEKYTEKEIYDLKEQTGQITISIFSQPYLSKLNIFFLIEVGNNLVYQDDIYEEMDMFTLNRKYLNFELGVVVENAISNFAKTFYDSRRDSKNDLYFPIQFGDKKSEKKR